MRRVVILGTGTAVGKTFVTVLLVRALAEAGERVRALKPIETGAPPSTDGHPAARTDAARLEAAARQARTGAQPIRPHPLYAYPEPVSPHLAARNAGQRLSLSRVKRWATQNEISTTLHAMSFLLVETAGAALSPLGPRLTNGDLALAFEPAVWVLVAPDALGVLHDVRATTLALAAVARPPDHLVLCAARRPDASTGSNARELGRVGLPKPIAVVSRGADAPGVLSSLVRALRGR